MDKIIRLAIVAGLVYAMFRFGGPILEEYLSDQGGVRSGRAGASESADCVTAAERAVEDFAKKASRFQPGSSVEQWNSAMSTVEGRIGRATDACSCNGQACRLGRDAINDLRNLVTAYGRSVRGSGGTFNPANDLERIYGKIEAASRESRAASPL